MYKVKNKGKTVVSLLLQNGEELYQYNLPPDGVIRVAELTDQLMGLSDPAKNILSIQKEGV